MSTKRAVTVTVLMSHFQFVHLKVDFLELWYSVLITSVYGSLNRSSRKDLWAEYCRFRRLMELEKDL